MVKKLLVFIMALGLALNASAQLTTIDPSDVQFWTGTGSNSTVVAIGWDDDSAPYTPTVVIWGVRWEGSIYLVNALDTIAAYDERFSYTMSGTMLSTISYNDPDEGLVLTPSMGWNCNNYGGAYGSTTLNSTHLRISESTCSNYTFTGVTNIVYAADPRFSYELGSWGLDDILFIVAEGDTLRKVPYSYWESKNNGYMDMGMGQTLANGDFEKWAEPAAGVIVDSMEYEGYWYYTYVYPMTINPVSVPDTIHDGIDDHEMPRVYAYPNPCTNTLYITNENAERIELYNANGKLLESIENRDTQVTLNMQQYPAGLYLLKVGNGVQKILKK